MHVRDSNQTNCCRSRTACRGFLKLSLGKINAIFEEVSLSKTSFIRDQLDVVYPYFCFRASDCRRSSLKFIKSFRCAKQTFRARPYSTPHSEDWPGSAKHLSEMFAGRSFLGTEKLVVKHGHGIRALARQLVLGILSLENWRTLISITWYWHMYRKPMTFQRWSGSANWRGLDRDAEHWKHFT